MTADYNNYTDIRFSSLDASKDLFRDVFVPLLLTRFDEKRVVKDKVRNKTITNGKSASFPLFGKCQAKYIGKGTKVLGQQSFNRDETTIFIDPYLVAAETIYDLDEKMSNVDDRAIIADEMAKALANAEDKQLLQVGVLAARHDALIQGGFGGSVLNKGASVRTTASELVGALFEAGVELDTKDVPEDNRFCYIKPLQYKLIAQYIDVKDHNIGSGNFSKGVTGEINNIQIVKTNHLPSTNITKQSDVADMLKNPYFGNFTDTVALVMNRDAIATVSLVGLKTEVSYNAEFFHDLITARIAQGHGILRPECAVEISAASASSNDTISSGTDTTSGGTDTTSGGTDTTSGGNG